MKDLDEILREIPSEGDPVKEQVEKPAEPKTEKKDEDSPTQEGEAEAKAEAPDEEPPRQNHKWAQMRAERRQEREAREALERELQDIKQQINSKSNESVEAPPEFVALFGDNKDAWQQFNALTAKQAERIVEERLAQERAAQEQVAREQERYQEIIQDEFEKLGDEVGEDFSDPQNSKRNAVLKFALEYAPTNAEGNIDLGKAYKLYKQLHPDKPVSDERKKIAAVSKDAVPARDEAKALKFGTARNFDLDRILQD